MKNDFFALIFNSLKNGNLLACAVLAAVFLFSSAARADAHFFENPESLECVRSLAETGDAVAQFLLGLMYNNGEGVAQNHREAALWYRRAAEQGDATAQNNLGAMYGNGEGVIQDDREAYIWFSIAKTNGNELAADSLRTNPWHQHLTAAEIKSAKREAARRLAEIESSIENAPAGETAAAPAAPPPKNAGVAEKVFENAWRSIVVINNGASQGSGVIVRPNVVTTNCHVLDGGGEIKIYKHDNRRASTDTLFFATIRRRDLANDFCLLDVAGLWGVQAAMRKFGTLKTGETAFALGSPEGLDVSLSAGIISQLREGKNRRYIQTDAAISPGSSGGGLFDSEGNLVGILTAKIADENVEGIGFAIPADLALNF